mgnify:CR=1 FL=1
MVSDLEGYRVLPNKTANSKVDEGNQQKQLWSNRGPRDGDQTVQRLSSSAPFNVRFRWHRNGGVQVLYLEEDDGVVVARLL